MYFRIVIKQTLSIHKGSQTSQNPVGWQTTQFYSVKLKSSMSSMHIEYRVYFLDEVLHVLMFYKDHSEFCMQNL